MFKISLKAAIINFLPLYCLSFKSYFKHINFKFLVLDLSQGSSILNMLKAF